MHIFILMCTHYTILWSLKCRLNYNKIKKWNVRWCSIRSIPLHTVNSRIWNKQQNLKTGILDWCIALAPRCSWSVHPVNLKYNARTSQPPILQLWTLRVSTCSSAFHFKKQSFFIPVRKTQSVQLWQSHGISLLFYGLQFVIFLTRIKISR